MNDLTIAEPIAADAIRSRILTIRGVQVMLDRDLAELYEVPTKALNQAVKRNIERFPEHFMFQLTKEDLSNLRSQIVTLNGETSLRSQIVTLNKRQGQHLKYMPYAFTEQGIAMLSAVLKSETAILVSIRIMDVFVAMRKALASFSPMLMRLDVVERRQIIDQTRNEERFKLILDAMQDKKFPPQKVFYDGQIYDAFDQMKKFVRMAKKELVIIDPYFADCVLPLVARKRQGVLVVVLKNSRNKLLHAVDVAQFNAQYANSLTVKTSDKFHDRFLIIDKTTLIHVGASLNHLGKKCFAFSSLDKSNIPNILAKL
ncbi:MAG: ORF6N domain-containing protein [Kiritimatiellae bacterium]|nr:ORF6N domain-containing protein [Kiritimatiellia bacterium]